ncbi:MAG: hypothetical protein ACFCVK_25695 [Acidimicrobiales bacterium]
MDDGFDCDGIAGELVSLANRTEIRGVTVWFAYTSLDGEATTVETTTDVDGRFCLELPLVALQRASIGTRLEGAPVIDLEPNGERLEPGDVVILVDDLLPSHLRYAT